MGLTDFIKTHKYKNWVKGVLALKYLKDGLCDFVTEQAEQQHNDILRKAGIQSTQKCDQCDWRYANKFRPHQWIADPDNRSKRKCPNNLNNCKCTRNDCKTCPKSICDKLFHNIAEYEKTKTPNVNKIDISKWPESPWEVQKCYIKTSGYEKTNSAEEVDASGLLILLKFNRYFSFGSNPIYLDKVKEWRDKLLFHSPSLELEDQQLNDGIQNIVSLFNSNTELCSKEQAKTALLNVKTLLRTDFFISTDHEEEVTRKALSAIEQKIIDLQRDCEETKAKSNNVETDVSGIHERLNKHDDEIQSLKSRVTVLENKIVALQNHKEIHRKHLMKIGVRKKLADRHRQVNVKTSLCPLRKQENDIEISDVYVWPNMTKITKESRLQSKESREQISHYDDIFCAKEKTYRRIYITGHVGSGKSAFIQMMISNWCTSVDLSEGNGDRNISAMSKFHFLFYLPLITLGMCNSVKEMIIQYYGDIVSPEVLDEILQNTPELCLVLADGLEEWTPQDKDFIREHETKGVPDASGMEQVTIVTTSRQTASGIVNMKYSDYDVKVTIHGLNKTSELKMLENYMPIEQHQEYMVKFQDISKLNLENTPFLLKHIIWSVSNNRDISIFDGNSVSDLYSYILNFYLRWFEQKSYKKQTKLETKNMVFQCLLLPSKLNKFPACQSWKNIIFSLSHVGFEIMTTRIPFGRSKMKQIDMHDLVDPMLCTGFLTEELHPNPTIEDTIFMFPQISHCEYFAALYVVCNTRVEIISDRCKSVKDLLDLEEMLVKVCGLAPKMTPKVCCMLYLIAQEDSNFIKIFDKDITKMLGYDLVQQSFMLIYRCICECEANGREHVRKVPIFAFMITPLNSQEAEKIMRYTDLETVFHLYVQDDITKKQNLNFIPSILKFQYLQSIEIEICNSIKHEVFDSLANCISRLPSLRNICLKIPPCRDCNKHCLDLSKHKLQFLQVLDANYCFKGPNTLDGPVKCIVNKTNLLKNMEINRVLESCKSLTLLRLNYERNTHETVTKLPQLRELILKDVKLQPGVFILVSSMQNISKIILDCVEMSFFSWCKFVESLAQLSQMVTVVEQLIDSYEYNAFVVEFRTNCDAPQEAPIQSIAMKEQLCKASDVYGAPSLSLSVAPLEIGAPNHNVAVKRPLKENPLVVSREVGDQKVAAPKHSVAENKQHVFSQEVGSPNQSKKEQRLESLSDASQEVDKSNYSFAGLELLSENINDSVHSVHAPIKSVNTPELKQKKHFLTERCEQFEIVQSDSINLKYISKSKQSGF